MATPDPRKPSYEITGLWVRTSPEGELEILVEHHGAWRVVFGRKDDFAALAPEDRFMRLLGVTVEDQAIDHCVHMAGLERLPLDRCRLQDELGTMCELESGHAGVTHHKGDHAFVVDHEQSSFHVLRQRKRADPYDEIFQTGGVEETGGSLYSGLFKKKERVRRRARRKR